ncbi:protein transport protein Sec24B-like, partial [Tropilaelaps mercedesae]
MLSRRSVAFVRDPGFKDAANMHHAIRSYFSRSKFNLTKFPLAKNERLWGSMNSSSSNNSQQQGFTGQQQWFQPSVGAPVIPVSPYRSPGNGLPQQPYATGQFTPAAPSQSYGQGMPPPPGGFPQVDRHGRAAAPVPANAPLKQEIASSTRSAPFSLIQPPGPPGGFPQPANNFQGPSQVGGQPPKSPQNNGVPMYNQSTPPLNGPPVSQPVSNGSQQTSSKGFGLPSGPVTNGLLPGSPSGLSGSHVNGPPQSMGFQKTNPPGPPLTAVAPAPPITNGPPVQTSLAGPPRPQYSAPPTGAPGRYHQQSESTPRGPAASASPTASPAQVPPSQGPQKIPPVHGSPHGGPVQTRRPMYPAVPPPMQSSSPVGYPASQYNGQGHPNGQGDYAANLTGPMAGLSVREGMNKLWGVEPVNLLQERDVLNAELPLGELSNRNCLPEVMRCTMTKVPETASLLQKSRLPLGIVLQPFRDLPNLPVLQITTIVRCRTCRTYINPFIQFIDRSRWKCNICFRLNDLPTDFLQDPVTGRFGDPEQRPEIQNGTVEYIAPSEYMVRPPQAATYLYVMDVSFQAVETGYLKVATEQILECLDHVPGDGRTTVGFITFDSTVHFYSLDGGRGLPKQM